MKEGCLIAMTVLLFTVIGAYLLQLILDFFRLSPNLLLGITALIIMLLSADLVMGDDFR